MSMMEFTGKERVSVRPVRSDVNIQQVLEFFSAFQHTSLRRAENELGIKKSSLGSILKDQKWHPFVMQEVQQLLPTDLNLRVAFAQEHSAFLAAQPDHLERIWWSDEANFHVNGAVNKHDFRYWSPTNPNFHREKALHSPKVVVWAAMSAVGIVGPYFFPGNVNAQTYCQMLEEVFIPQMQNRPDFDTMLFQQDGAPPHYALQTRALLDEVFPERWIGRASPNLNWPPRSPDLTVLDFFFWGYIKSKELPDAPRPIPPPPAVPVQQNPLNRRRRASPLRNVDPPRRRGRPSNQPPSASNAPAAEHARVVEPDIPPFVDAPDFPAGDDAEIVENAAPDVPQPIADATEAQRNFCSVS
uniref:Transposase n=1 Tax=Panagrolaimus sp. ES5 TaxID=591445 RepID=A0AC34GUD2_9BILA